MSVIALAWPKGGALEQGIRLAHWDDGFSDAFVRLLQLGQMYGLSPRDWSNGNQIAVSVA